MQEVMRLTKDYHSPNTSVLIPVNISGIAGGGLARVFRDTFPSWHSVYMEECGKKSMFPTSLRMNGSLYCISCPTKDHPRNDSTKTGVCQALHSSILLSVAVGCSEIITPALGCGLGGLDVAWFREAINKVASDMSDYVFKEVTIRYYEHSA